MRRLPALPPALAAALAAAAGCTRQAPLPAEWAFVGSARCAECHPQQASAWRGSQHEQAMMEPSPTAVRGDFANASFAAGGTSAAFARRGADWMVTTEGPDGAKAPFRVAYAFGREPLQQYLLPLAGGRLQALGVAWDCRAREVGGQRWFHLYPDDPPRAGDEVHWTGLQQNANYMCLECHTTGLRRGYDAEKDLYATQWTELGVGCEGCHGEGSRHVAWAEREAAGERLADADLGLRVRFLGRRGVSWSTDPATGLPRRSVPAAGVAAGEVVEVEACARCHARRTQFAEDWRPGANLLEAYQPALLAPGLYWPDGQMRDEVYVHGSFRQSRMYAAGVTCSDCHEPHTGKVRAAGDGTCLQCHEGRFAEREHHHHAPGTAASACVACHAPTVTYMGVDARHDHSFRVPRPDLTVAYGVPDACSGCHRDHDAKWAAARVKEWYGRLREDRATWTAAFAAADELAHGRCEVEPTTRALLAVAGDAALPAWIRASALDRLPRPFGSAARVALRAAVSDRDPLVRWAAATAFLDAGADERFDAAVLLRDPVRGVRIAAACALADVAGLTAEAAAALPGALAEYEASLATNADRPEAWLSLGNLRWRQRRPTEAEVAFRRAVRGAASFVAGWTNLAQLLADGGREGEAEAALRAGLAKAPKAAALQHALGLSLVRQRRLDEALGALRVACEWEPGEARYALVYSVAQRETGRAADAVGRLEALVAQRPVDREVLAELVRCLAAAGPAAADRARARAADYVAAWPDDAAAREFVGLLR